jgi:hypothetical protein
VNLRHGQGDGIKHVHSRMLMVRAWLCHHMTTLPISAKECFFFPELSDLKLTIPQQRSLSVTKRAHIATMILLPEHLPADPRGLRLNNAETDSTPAFQSPPSGRILSKEALDALDQLGHVLRGIYRGMVREGYTLVDGEIHMASSEVSNEPTQ